MVDSLRQPGGIYMKCGVMLGGLNDAGREQADLFAAVDTRGGDLMAPINVKWQRAQTSINIVTC